MSRKGNIKYKTPMLITEKRVRELNCIILEYCNEIVYEIYVESQTFIQFDSIEKLLNHDNFKGNKIKAMKLKGYFENKSMIEVVLNRNDFGVSIFSESEILNCDFYFDNEKKEQYFRNQLDKYVQKSKINSSILNILNGQLIVNIVIISIPSIISCYKWGYLVDKIDVLVISALYSFSVLFLLNKPINKIAKIYDTYFPKIAFCLGEESELYDKRERVKSSVKGFMLGSIATFFISFIYSKLTGG